MAERPTDPDPYSGCTCGPTSGCKTKKCGCVNRDVFCSIACGCDKAECTRRSSLRSDVSKQTDNIWRYRGDVDAYTKRSRRDSERSTSDLQNDHVWEIQVLQEAQWSLEPACNTRLVTDTLMAIANHTCNFNVTTKDINQAKKGPFTTWCNNYYDSPISLDEAIGKTHSDYCKKMKGLGYWDNIKKEVVKTYDVMTESLQDPAKVIGDRYKPSHNVTKAVKTYEEELYNRLTAMKID